MEHSETKPHVMLPDTLHDEQALQDFVRSLRGHLAARVSPGHEVIYERWKKPEFERKHGREPADYHEVRQLMMTSDYYQFWSSMQRCSQEMMWDSVIGPTERQLDALIDQYRDTASAPPAGGSLRLDPGLEIPRYHTAADIHLQPGGYHTDNTEDDVAAGVLYEAGLPIYIGGALGPLSDFLGRVSCHYVSKTWPDFKPRRILDMGCAVGNTTLPWCEVFPEAQIEGIDVGAPCLRYAHARAEALGLKAHFSQQNAEHTDFEAESFDLIVSHIMLHETSRSALPNIFAESRRLLRPGGMALHLDIPRGEGPFEQFLFNWETYNNNENFARYMTDIDLAEVARKAGFSDTHARMIGVPSGFGQEQRNYTSEDMIWPVLLLEKAP